MSLVVQMADDLKALDRKHVEQSAADLLSKNQAIDTAPREVLPLFAAADQLHAKAVRNRSAGWWLLLLLTTVCVVGGFLYWQLNSDKSTVQIVAGEKPLNLKEPVVSTAGLDVPVVEAIIDDVPGIVPSVEEQGTEQLIDMSMESAQNPGAVLNSQTALVEENANEVIAVSEVERSQFYGGNNQPASNEHPLSEAQVEINDGFLRSTQQQTAAPVMQKAPSQQSQDERLYERAFSLQSANLAAAALELLEKELPAGDFSQHKQSATLYTALLLESQRLEQAQQVIVAYRSQYPESLPFAKHHIRLLMANAHFEQAQILLDSYRLPVEQDSDFTALQAAVYQAQQQWRLAAESYQQLLAVFPYSSDYWIGLAVALDAGGDLVAARNAYRQALATGQLTGELQQYARNRLSGL